VKAMTTKRLPLNMLAASVILLAGCTSLAPSYERPIAPVPDQWNLVQESVDVNAQRSSAASLS